MLVWIFSIPWLGNWAIGHPNLWTHLNLCSFVSVNFCCHFYLSMKWAVDLKKLSQISRMEWASQCDQIDLHPIFSAANIVSKWLWTSDKWPSWMKWLCWKFECGNKWGRGGGWRQRRGGRKEWKIFIRRMKRRRVKKWDVGCYCDMLWYDDRRLEQLVIHW